jgi:hypothetical protein
MVAPVSKKPAASPSPRPPAPATPSKAPLATGSGLGASIAELVSGGRSDSLSVAASGDRSAAAAVAARRSGLPSKKSTGQEPKPPPAADSRLLAPAPLNLAELAGRDVPTFCRIWNSLVRDRSPKWVLSSAEIDRLAETLPPVLVQYLPAVEKYGAEVALGFCLLTIVLPRVDFRRSPAPAASESPSLQKGSPFGPPAPAEKVRPPDNPLSVFFPDGVPPELAAHLPV